MIPKIIHYCWFGPKKIPYSFKKNIRGWKKLCPDFEFKFWNEDNFDFSKWSYAQEAYDSEHWGYVSDPLRYWVLYKYGGFYIDLDVKLYKNLNGLCNLNGFSVIDSTGNRNWCHTAFLGSKPNNEFILEMLKSFDDLVFDYKNGYFNLKVSQQYLTEACHRHGFQNTNELFEFEDFTLLPSDYCLQQYSYKNRMFTDNTYGYHKSTSLCYTPTDLKRLNSSPTRRTFKNLLNL